MKMSGTDKMRVEDREWFKDFVRMADDGYRMGWHERNGGNLSYRIKDGEAEAVSESFNASAWKPIGAQVPELAGEYFLITGTGKFFRNISIRPADTLGIIEINPEGDSYRTVWGYVNGAEPTSELPTHLLNHQVKKRVSGGTYRVVYHAHPENIIALTFILPLSDEVFTRELWGMMTECPIVFPAGIGVVPWMVPGGSEIGLRTCELMERYDVALWAHHGLFATGVDFDLTFGLMHTIEKSAAILLKQMSTGRERLSAINQDQFKELAERFCVTLDDRFFDQGLTDRI